MKNYFDRARWLGVLCIAIALVVLFVWIPMDVDSGIVEKVRRRFEIGDAMAPTLAGGILLIAGLLLVLNHTREAGTGSLSRENLLFLLQLLAIVFISLILMRWAGEIAVLTAQAFGSEIDSYRALRDTAPWKYLGFFCGGVCLIGGLIYLVERRVNLHALLIAIAVTTLMILVYDLPFDDLLLPPNGDV